MSCVFGAKNVVSNNLREGSAVAPRPVWRWVVRQTALGLVLLAIFVAGGAWLLNASIEPDGDRSAPFNEPASAD